jgi:hypothetical protein
VIAMVRYLIPHDVVTRSPFSNRLLVYLSTVAVVGLPERMYAGEVGSVVVEYFFLMSCIFSSS